MLWLKPIGNSAYLWLPSPSPFFPPPPPPYSLSLYPKAYRTEEGKPWVLPVVRTIEAQMSSDPTLNKEYLPLSGMPALTEGLTKLLLGESSLAITQNRV